jgi:hypothetical protein
MQRHVDLRHQSSAQHIKNGRTDTENVAKNEVQNEGQNIGTSFLGSSVLDESNGRAGK